MKRSKKGFTLAELLIVIAIIAILIAVMFPVFGAQLDKARAAADLANVRAKYSELVADAMLGKDNDLTSTDFSEVSIDTVELAKAMQYEKSTVTITTGNPGTIKVDYGDYNGSFNIDSDVKFTLKGAEITSPTTLDKNGDTK